MKEAITATHTRRTTKRGKEREMLGNWFQTLSRGLEQVVKLGQSIDDSENTLLETNNSVHVVTNQDSHPENKRNLKRPLLPSIDASFQAEKRRHTTSDYGEEDYTQVQNSRPPTTRRLTFLEKVRRNRQLKAYTDRQRKRLVEEHKTVPENSEENNNKVNDSLTANQSNIRLEVLRRKEQLSLQKEINMLKQKIQQLKQQESKKAGLLAVYDDSSSSLLEQKMLLSTSKLLDKAVFHEEASEKVEQYQKRSEQSLLLLRSKSALHKNRALFYAQLVRKGLDSLNEVETAVPAQENLEKQKSSQLTDNIIELSDSTDDDDEDVTSNGSDEEEDDAEYIDELFSSLSEYYPFLSSSQDALTPGELNKYLTKGFNLCYADDEKNPLSKLSAKALTYCKSVLKEPKNRLLVCRNGMKITRNDLRLLLPGNWLNDEIINFYMSLLQQRNEKEVLESNNKIPRCLFLSSFFYCKLLSRGQYDYAAVKRWTRNIDVFNYDKIIIPLNIKNCHWILAVIDIQGKRFICYDSIGGSHVDKLRALEQWLRDEHSAKLGFKLETSSYSFEQPPVPRQSNTDDCGVFCCQFARYTSSNWEISFTSKDMNYFRLRMMLEILCQRVS